MITIRSNTTKKSDCETSRFVFVEYEIHIMNTGFILVFEFSSVENQSLGLMENFELCQDHQIAFAELKTKKEKVLKV